MSFVALVLRSLLCLCLIAGGQGAVHAMHASEDAAASGGCHDEVRQAGDALHDDPLDTGTCCEGDGPCACSATMQASMPAGERVASVVPAFVGHAVHGGPPYRPPPLPPLMRPPIA